MLRIYQILSILLIPIIIFNIFIRIYRKKEDRLRFIERFGKPTVKKNSERKILWIHAASIGEFKSSDLKMIFKKVSFMTSVDHGI